MANRFSIPLFQVANQVYAGTSVSFFTVDGNGQKTTTLATLYEAPTGTDTLANPQTLDGDGKFIQPVYCEEPVIGVVSGLSAPGGDTGILVNTIRYRGDWATATVYAVNDFVRVPVSNPSLGGNIYYTTTRHTSAADIATDIAAGRMVLFLDAQGTFPYVQLSGDTMTGALILSGDPASALQAATKQYVDNLVSGAKWKASVRAASTANLTLSGEQTIDGVALVAGDRVLVKDQGTTANNGIYVVAAGAWSRSTDADSWTDLVAATVRVEEGTTNAEKTFINTANSGGTLGVTAITFVDFGGTLALATETVAGIVELATQAEAEAGASNSVVPTVLRTLQLIDALRNAYDIAFIAGYDATFTKEDLAVQTYGKVTVPRAMTITGEEADVETAPTGAALILDIEKNGVSIYSVKPQFAAGSTTLTAGTRSTSSVSAGDVLTFKATQVGSTEPGEGVTFSLKGKIA